jgi:hypothetical protein
VSTKIVLDADTALSRAELAAPAAGDAFRR